jgi:hypothetical protein
MRGAYLFIGASLVFAHCVSDTPGGGSGTEDAGGSGTDSSALPDASMKNASIAETSPDSSPPPPPPGPVLYVSANGGDDARDGLAPTRSVRTIRAGLAKAKNQNNATVRVC